MRGLLYILFSILISFTSSGAFAFCGEAPPMPCDIDVDGDVDVNDIEMIGLAKGSPSSGPDDPMDVDGDGEITVKDARQCVLLCGEPNCVEPGREDTTPPEVEITSPVNGSLVQEPLLAVQGTATDLSGIASVVVNGVIAALSNDIFSATVALNEGLNTVTAIATDNAGNVAQDSITVEYNSTPIQIGKEVEYPGPEAVDQQTIDSLPTESETGLPLLYSVNGGAILVDLEKRDPITGLGRCSNWIASCVSPAEDRSLDDCARSAPKCTTNEPWSEASTCCPSSCFGDYESKRLAGSDDMETFQQVYLIDGSCYPGYRELLD